MSKQLNNTRKLALNSSEKKPSVFERLGSKSGFNFGKNICQSWAQSGTCSLNKQCRLAQTHVVIGLSKRSKAEAMKKSSITHKKCKEDHKKSFKSQHSSELEWEGWELGDLEDADEKVLEKRKQELQRELQLQLKKEKELTKKKKKRSEKKRATSTSSSSTTTTDSSSSTSSSTTSSSEPRKQSHRKRKHSSSSSESETSSHKLKKNPKVNKAKVTTIKKTIDKKDVRTTSDTKTKNLVVSKKSSIQKKSYSPSWEKSQGRTPTLKQTIKKTSPRSPDVSKRKSSSPRFDKATVKNKGRSYSPKSKIKESSPKKINRKAKESNIHTKEKPRSSPSKGPSSPSKGRKMTPPKSRRRNESSEKRRGHYDDRKHSPRRDRSKEKERKRDIRRGRSNDDDNGGLKKGGKILPLKPVAYNKETSGKRDTIHQKSVLTKELKAKEEDIEKNRSRIDREKEKVAKDKNKCERDRSKHKKGNDEHDRRSARERDSDRSAIRNRDERGRDKESERLRFVREREAERQKEREEALERCRERQRERDRLEKERKDKEEKKQHQRESGENKSSDYDKELPSLLEIKAENPNKSISCDSVSIKTFDKHLSRDGRRNLDKSSDKLINQEKDMRDRGTPDKEHDRRDIRRSEENDRRQSDKDYDTKRNREVDLRNALDVRRNAGDCNEIRRQWEDVRRSVDPLHDRRRTLDSVVNDRRQHSLGRRPPEDLFRCSRNDPDNESRDFPLDDRRCRKIHNSTDWDIKDHGVDYRGSEGRDDWSHTERHHDWNSRYDHKWVDREEARDANWNHFPRRQPNEEWNGDWSKDSSRPLYSEEKHLDATNEDIINQNGKRLNESDANRSVELNREKESLPREDGSFQPDKSQKEGGDALSDISDDPDDILNQDEDPVEENNSNKNTPISNQQIYIGNNEFLFDQRKSLLECLGERSLDFEEISDEELEEEARVNKGIVDVLGADWAGLLRDTRPKPKCTEGLGSAHSHWMIKRLVCSLGISFKHAGKEFSYQLMNNLEKIGEKGQAISEGAVDSKKDINEKTEDKIEKTGESENCIPNKVETVNQNEINLEADPNDLIDSNGIFHSVPAMHCAVRDTRRKKAFLFSSHNRFKRALSARTDLCLRRELCNLPSKEPLHFVPPLDSRMYEAGIQQLQGITPMAAG